MSERYTLLSAASATGAGVSINSPASNCIFSVAGTFGGASVGLQMLGPDGVTWITLKDQVGAIEFTSADAIFVSLPIGTYRATVTGGTGVSLYAQLARAS